MNTIVERIKIGNPIGNLYRKNLVLILVRDSEGSFILGQKKPFYPDDICRLIGGGINEGEEAVVAAQREAKEELALDIPKSSLRTLCVVHTLADTSEGPMEMLSHLFALELTEDQVIVPSDDISGIKSFSRSEYLELIERMKSLTGEYATEKFSFLWSDWGKIYAPIHMHALNELLK